MTGAAKSLASPATAALLRAREARQREAGEAEQAARVAVMRRHGFGLDGPPDDRAASKWRAVRQLAEREALTARGAFLQANPEPRIFGVLVPL